MITWRLILPQQQANEKNQERRTMSSAERIAKDQAPNGARPPSRLRQPAVAAIGNAACLLTYPMVSQHCCECPG